MQAGTWLLPYSWDWPTASPQPSLAMWLLLGRVTLAPGGRKVRGFVFISTWRSTALLCALHVLGSGLEVRLALSMLGDTQRSNHTQP